MSLINRERGEQKKKRRAALFRESQRNDSATIRGRMGSSFPSKTPLPFSLFYFLALPHAVLELQEPLLCISMEIM